MAGFPSAFLLCHKKRGHQEQHNSLPSVSNLFVDSSSLGDIHVYPVLRTLLFFFQVKETSSLHLLFGLPERGVRWSLGYQMFGFREPVLGPSSSTRGRVRLSGFGHVGLGGSVALCDPASGLAFAMVTNKVGSSVAVLACTFTAIFAELADVPHPCTYKWGAPCCLGRTARGVGASSCGLSGLLNVFTYGVHLRARCVVVIILFELPCSSASKIGTFFGLELSLAQKHLPLRMLTFAEVQR